MSTSLKKVRAVKQAVKMKQLLLPDRFASRRNKHLKHRDTLCKELGLLSHFFQLDTGELGQYGHDNPAYRCCLRVPFVF